VTERILGENQNKIRLNLVLVVLSTLGMEEILTFYADFWNLLQDDYVFLMLVSTDFDIRSNTGGVGVYQKLDWNSAI